MLGSIDEKPRPGEIVFLTDPMEERGYGFVPWRLNDSAFGSNFVSTSVVAYNHDHSPSIVTGVSSTVTCLDIAVTGTRRVPVGCTSVSLSGTTAGRRHCQTAHRPTERSPETST
jgi:hypothetical protein